MQAWHDLDPAWRAAFELAWEAFRARTVPVGAVVTRGDDVLARGRNRIFESGRPAREVFGSRVAHAEINALLQLPPSEWYYDGVLWTTLEPCAQCIGAAWVSTIGAVRYAAPDVYGGAARMIEREIEDRESWRPAMPVSGPIDNAFGRFCQLLFVAFFLVERPDVPVAATLREQLPDVCAQAARLRLHELAGAPLEAALPQFIDDL